MPVHTDESVTLYAGDATAVLRGLPSASVHCVVTSPPYYGLRDYDHPDQLGVEETPAAYVARLAAVFAEVRRVLRADGTCWVNLGDSYAGRANGGPSVGMSRRADRASVIPPRRNTTAHAPYKSLLGIPWRVALALQDDGWTIRNAITWHKTNGMPESVTDRFANRTETVFLLTRSARYWFDLDPVREAPIDPAGGAEWTTRRARGAPGRRGVDPAPSVAAADRDVAPHGGGRNPGDVWSLPVASFDGGHFAVFPPEIPRRAILTGCPPGGVVLDPFSGSGTTGMVAGQLGRRYIGIDLNPDYHQLALRTRLRDRPLPGIDSEIDTAADAG
ncbi:site-specific DNA-methyltransferase [Frankia sp. AgB32]|uniref:site-specific DNA-methyltransferase n=1 Tax=Frankia sp. AgB32 TaxID=631119 RepID=UPI0034D6377F